jgi:hypothetical protein
VGGKLDSAGFTVLLQEKEGTQRYPIKYPPSIWKEFPRPWRQPLLDNFAFVSTCHLPWQRRHVRQISYRHNRPLAFPSYLTNLFFTLPFDAFMNGHKSPELYRTLLNTQFSFSRSRREKAAAANPRFKLDPRKAVIPFTFGKDSLLTFALARELKMKTRLVFIEEPRELYAAAHKKESLRKFSEEFTAKVDFLPNPAGILRDVSAGTGWFGWELLLTSFVLLLLPYNYFERAQYLLFANEASCNELTTNGEGISFYPVFEQTDAWTQEETNIARNLTHQPFTVGSLLGPIHEIAIIKVLHQRYPEMAKYQMSCFADRKEAKHKKWCAACSKCARNYIFLKAFGLDPKRVGFTDNMLDGAYRDLYSLLEDDGKKEGYDATTLGRDEQLLAFYLAFKRGVSGELMEIFRKKYLPEALRRKDKLFNKYFSLHPSAVLPEEYATKILSIFRQELKK